MDKKDEILALKKEKKAIILAHYYQEPDIQDVADFVGDSLGLSQQAASTDAEIIVFAGVHFMAETAKILNPGKKVLLPDAGAGCSLADSCPPAKFKEFLAAHPDHTAVTYINCSAEIKALSDIICTSANAIDVVNSIPEGKPIIFAPDRNLGRFVAQQTGRDLLLWQGACVVHEAFSKTKIESLICAHPDARMIAHPESTAEILEKADFIGSTSAMIEFIQKDPADKFIIATEAGILHQMRKKVPHKTLIPAPSVENNSCACSECPYMKMNTLDKLLNCLRYETPAIEVPEDIRKKALQPLARMLEISSRKKGKTTIHAAH